MLTHSVVRKMTGICKLEITETTEELKSLLQEQKSASNFQKVQALYLFKIGQVKTVKDLAITLGRSRITVQRWLHTYRTEGLAGLLKVKHGGGRKPVIPGAAMAGLQKRLQDPNSFFSSYGEIQTWLQSEYGLDVSYKVVYATVRYKLKAGLKVRRPKLDQRAKPDSKQ
ncbi:MAG: helix-turn-helix domain-containing protein [Hormoscilla sp. SP5CHS1]|nr:helix-turn-helix domain-containing protein [Hormoscilla sp. SP12CHS1]MBC6456056.1 helix-turn-helix domain-containing protein [Hormoscilla sp. SP5CHS1]